MKIYTIGHSTRSLENFLAVLKHYDIQLVIDVRRFPSSKKFPWFNKESLEKELTGQNVQYIHYAELGGYRKEGYANFAKSDEFRTALDELIKTIDEKAAIILCAERFFWKCHRKYIANELSKLDHQIIHILDKETTYEHKLKSKDTEEKMSLKIFCDKKARKFTTQSGSKSK